MDSYARDGFAQRVTENLASIECRSKKHGQGFIKSYRPNICPLSDQEALFANWRVLLSQTLAESEKDTELVFNRWTLPSRSLTIAVSDSCK